MSETLAELEQRLGAGTVAKIAELLGLSPPQPLPRVQPGGDRDLIVRFLLRENENLLIEREHLRQVVLALAETTDFLPQSGRPSDHAALRLVADFNWERDQHGGGIKKNSFTLAEDDGYHQRWGAYKPQSLERKYYAALEGSEIKGIVEDRDEPYEELIRIFAVKPD
jgi:hypothetical protein